MKPVILVDMDNTLNYFNKHFFKYVSDLGYPLKRTRYASYNLTEAINLPEEDSLNVIQRIFNIDEFWLTIPIMEYSQEILEKLNKDYNVFIVTIARKKTIKYDARSAKRKYVKIYYPYISDTHLIFKNDKWNLNYSYIMDDSPEILINCANRGKGEIIKFELKYNEELFADYSVTNWKQVEKIFYN